MKAHQLFAVLTVCLFLAGCFDLNQTLTVNEDRTLRYKGELAVPTLLTRMTEAQSGEAFSCEKDFSLVTNTGANVEVKEAERGGNKNCLFILETALQDEIEIGLKAAGEEDTEPLMVLRKIDGGRYRVTSDFTSLGAYADDSEIGQAYGAAAKTVMETLFDDRAVRWVITAPKVLNSNGDISQDRTSVSWEAPLSELIDTDENMAFVAEIQVPQSVFGRVRSFFSGIGGVFGGTPSEEESEQEPDAAPGADTRLAPNEKNSESLLSEPGN